MKMKLVEIIEEFKAFEIKNQQLITGGLEQLWITWVGTNSNGDTICDAEGAHTHLCSMPDAGCKFGQTMMIN